MAIKEGQYVHIEGDWVIVHSPEHPNADWGKDSELGTDSICENVLIKKIEIFNS